MRNVNGAKVVVENGFANVRPIPVPEPPRVVNTRFSVPDLSVSSESAIVPSALKNGNNNKTQLKKNFIPSKRREHVDGNHLNEKRIKFNDNYNEFGVNNYKRIDETVEDFSKTELIKILKSQDEQLERISKQIENLLKIHNCCNEKPKPKTRSVETMTSLIVNEKHKQSNHSSQLSKFHSDGKRSKSKVSKRFSSNELIHRSNNSEIIYDRLLLNISDSVNEILKNSDCSMNDDNEDSDESRDNDLDDDDGENVNKYCKSVRKQRKQQNVHSEQTLIINELASKYLIKDKRKKDNHYLKFNNKKTREKKLSITQAQDNGEKENNNPFEYNSIATRNYLEKYGLLNRI